ncbi:MAG: hypothetical protein WCW56_03580 [Candidatus Paceibacterota bacterium]|jgi:hypothetical protein
MSTIIESKTSVVPGGVRYTTGRDDGTHTDITQVGNEITIDDHDSDGGTKSYVGVTGIFGIVSSATRLKEK